MKTKKMLSLALSSAMALSMSAPAFAAGPSSTASRTTNILEEAEASAFEVALDGSVFVPTIRVQVSDTGSLYVNPSKGAIKGKITGVLATASDPADLSYQFEGLGVASTPVLIRSDTDADLAVSATVTATTGRRANMTISATAPTNTETAKKVYMYVTGSELGAYDPTASGGSAFKGSMDETGFSEPGGNNVTAGEDYAIIAASGTAVTASKVCEITAATFEDKLDADGNAYGSSDTPDGVMDTVVPTYAAIMIQGDATAKPTEAWTESDTVSATVALTFSFL